MIKLIIFDLDGVLVDMKDMHFLTLNAAISDYDSKFAISYNEHLSKYDGMKTYDKLNKLSIEKGLPQDSHKQIWKNKQAKTLDYLRQLKPNDNITNVLKELKKQNFIIAVASNSIRDTVKNTLCYTGYNEYIDFFYSNDDVKLAKPNTEIYLKCMIKAGVSPRETIIIEDSPIGVLGAENTGANIVRVSNSHDINQSLLNKINKMNNSVIKNKWKDERLNILIPMAGAGSRFEKAGYTFPKPLISVDGDPMIKVVIDNLNIDANYIFIVQKDHLNKYNLQYLLNMITPNCKIVTTEGVTEGAACTALLAKEFINNECPLLIANSDQFVEWDSANFMYSMENNKIDGGILTFESTHPKWSFVKLGDDGFINEVAEKKPISNIATVGIYYWTRGSDFVKYAEEMIEKNIRVNNEFYICPVYTQAIEDNKKIKPYNIRNMWGLGTPEDLNIFINQYKN